MTPAEIEQRLLEHFPDARIVVRDLTGTQDHYDVEIVSQAFAGKRLVQQHQLVYRALDAELKSGEVHALKLSTKTPG